MTAKDAISPQIAPLKLSATYGEAVDTLKQADHQSLPVVDSEGSYVGMFAEAPAGILPDQKYHSLEGHLNAVDAVRASYPVSMLLESMVSSGNRIVPIVEDSSNIYVGAVDAGSMLAYVAKLFPQLQESTELTVTCSPGNYSASAIAHAVEDADAHLLNLNVVEGTEPNSRTTVLIRVNHSRGDSVARSLARYGYDTVGMTGTSGMGNAEMAERINELLHYLEV